MEAPMGSRKKIRISKNRKKSWNKVCDITEIEDYLEDKRFEERIGGPATEKPDSELFCVEKTPSRKDIQHPVSNKKLKKPLKCHQSIGVYSKVPTPVNLDKIKYSKRIKQDLTRAENKRQKLIARQLQIREKVAKVVKKPGVSLFAKDFEFDLWAKEKAEDPEISDLLNYQDEMTAKKPPKVPCYRYQKPSLLPSVEIPHPGASYNPAFEDHQELLREAVQIELNKEKKELHLKRVLTDMFPTKSEAPTEKSIMAEMAQGLFDEDDEEETDIKNTSLSTNPPVTRENKLKKSLRKKRKAMREQLRLKALEKLSKKRLNDVYRLHSIKSEIKVQDALTKKRHAKRELKHAEKMYQPNTIGQYKYEPNDLEVNLSEELRGSLRAIKVEGNILEDRYKSLQKRNVIEPRIKQKFKRKYKLKVQVKRSHRNFN